MKGEKCGQWGFPPMYGRQKRQGQFKRQKQQHSVKILVKQKLKNGAYGALMN
eukprot:CAMPEP_0180335338 /NCGR_PEP_ID=MMETSP0988-20121125/44188_1 /TAXON_ID=697907 /ORGANISM="non described non described, Strain CCMP2293" /LENGTH=51 /DNA_ID=CAMNT_0022323395 /DNA_START=16 /DNA_END=168 /DNA_ORIENTATION=+